MSRFLGVFSPDGKVLPGGAAEDRDGASGTQGQGSQPLTVAVDGEPWWPGLPRTPGTAAADRVADAWRRYGPDLFRHARGHYAVALADHAARRLLLAVDRTGIGALAYAPTADGSVVFGTSVGAVAADPRVRTALRPQALYDYLHFHNVPAPDTAFAGVSKLRPGHVVTIAAGRATAARHWEPRFASAQSAPLPELRDALFAALRAGVRRALDGAAAPAAFLSGGLDSSTVSGLAAEELAPGRARTFSIGFAAEGYDEREFARLAIDRFGLDAAEVEVTPDDIVEVIPLLAAGFDEPFGNSSAVPTFVCARAARRAGVSRLLAGDGGDELFGGNAHYARQGLFELYYRVPRALRRALFEGAIRRLIPPEAPFPFGKVRSYIDQASIPLPRRLHSWDFMFRTAPERVFTPDFLGAVERGNPDRLMDAVYAEPETGEYLDRLLYFDWEFVLADSDLRKVGRSCELAGVEVRYPMLDDDVIDFSLSLPPPLKTSGQVLRPFYKQSMAGFLPDGIINKSKHGFGLPFGLWLKTVPALRALVAASFASLRRRGIINAAFLDEVVREHADGHASYFGYVIWDLVMLEQWLQHHPAAGNGR